jgi:DnaJ-class molecular chaperone
MSWDWKPMLHGSAGPTQAPLRPRGEGIVFQRASAQALSTALDASIRLIEDLQLPCAFCRGKGHLANGGICPVCSGQGKIQAHPPAVRCAFCRGAGQSPPRSGLTCGVCKGKGVVPVPGPVKTCPDCRGAGKRRTQTLYCRTCGGAGVVEIL